MNAILIGSSTGIGAALTRVMSRAGIKLAIAGRNVEKMQELSSSLAQPAFVQKLDLCDLEGARAALFNMIDHLQDVDLIIVNSGVGGANYELDWKKEKRVIDVNVTGFTCMMDEAFLYFQQRKKGQIVGVSSMAGIRGFWHSPSYNAAKAYNSNYMQALRSKADYLKLPITVTDIVPGFVLTPLIEGKPSLFWVSSAPKAAEQIWRAIVAQKRKAYITRRWFLISILLRIIPEFLYFKVINRAKLRGQS